MDGKLFHSMVSVRQAGTADAEPHLGLGLFVARLIAEFHGGTIAAGNRPTGDGVSVTVDLPAA
jgi:signal transduction histidine kinase